MSNYMTDAEYAANYGLICPVCRSGNVYAPSTAEPSCAGQSYNGNVCRSYGAEWVEITRVVGYIDLVDPKHIKEIRDEAKHD